MDPCRASMAFCGTGTTITSIGTTITAVGSVTGYSPANTVADGIWPNIRYQSAVATNRTIAAATYSTNASIPSSNAAGSAVGKFHSMIRFGIHVMPSSNFRMFIGCCQNISMTDDPYSAVSGLGRYIGYGCGNSLADIYAVAMGSSGFGFTPATIGAQIAIGPIYQVDTWIDIAGSFGMRFASTSDGITFTTIHESVFTMPWVFSTLRQFVGIFNGNLDVNCSAAMRFYGFGFSRPV